MDALAPRAAAPAVPHAPAQRRRRATPTAGRGPASRDAAVALRRRSGHRSDPHAPADPPPRSTSPRCAGLHDRRADAPRARCARAASRTSPTRSRSPRSCADLGMDTTTLVAALLHDTVEDTRYTLPQLAERLRPRGGAAGRRGHQVRQGLLRRDRRGRDDPQDAASRPATTSGCWSSSSPTGCTTCAPSTPARPPPGPASPGRPGRADPALRPARHPGPQARAGGQRAAGTGAGVRTRGSTRYVRDRPPLDRVRWTGSITSPARRC